MNQREIDRLNLKVVVGEMTSKQALDFMALQKKPTAGELRMNDPREIWPGARVLVFDSHLFQNDKDTPLSQTMQSATVLRRYGYKSIHHCDVCYGDYGEIYGEPTVWYYPDLVDVRFDHDGRESKGHFTYGIDLLQ